MKTIVLTGMMGAGKTTLAEVLAQKLNIKYIDIDTLIESNEGKKIADIFTQNGETYFRKIEKETIKQITTPTDLVISLGGGALENKDTRDLLLTNTTVIYLKTSPEIIFERIKNNTSRPLLCGNMSVEKIKEILEKREANYQSATLTITTDNKTPEQIADEITGVL
ncbi:shikimate kinase [bacterium]|nr:shikimate kinase [bacterium]